VISRPYFGHRRAILVVAQEGEERMQPEPRRFKHLTILSQGAGANRREGGRPTSAFYSSVNQFPAKDFISEKL